VGVTAGVVDDLTSNETEDHGDPVASAFQNLPAAARQSSDDVSEEYVDARTGLGEGWER
jgi:hypothetical protein